MDCKAARLLLDFAGVPGELAGSETAALDQHLISCSACSALEARGRRFDDAVGTAMRAVPIPIGLRERLLTRLQQQRPAWYRRRVVQTAALAACLLISALLTWQWQHQQREIFAVNTVRESAESKLQASHQEVEKWLARLGDRNLVAPADFNYHLLATYELVPLDGRLTPRLFFVRGDQGTRFAQVYILSGAMHNLDAIRKQTPSESGVVHMQVQEAPNNPHVLFLILYNTPSLELFKLAPPIQG